MFISVTLQVFLLPKMLKLREITDFLIKPLLSSIHLSKNNLNDLSIQHFNY